MTKQDVYKDIESTLGLVPGFFKTIPDDAVELEWKLFKKLQLDESAIPAKYKELIGLGIAATTKCRYCVAYHTEAARLFGATDAEIEDALHFAKSSAGWSAYINGFAPDYDEFKREVKQITEFVRKNVAKKPKAPGAEARVH